MGVDLVQLCFHQDETALFLVNDVDVVSVDGIAVDENLAIEFLEFVICGLVERNLDGTSH